MGAFFWAFDWQHSALLGGAIIGGILVGVGILMESEKWSLAAILVLIGIILEPIFTIGLFLYDEYLARGQESIIRTQNDKIISLETKLAPRVLSGVQLEALVAALKPFSGQKYAASVAAGAEAAHLFCMLDRSLIAAGWLRQQPTGLLQVSPCPKGMEPKDHIDLDVWSAVRVHTRFNPAPQTYEAANVLVSTLKANAIEIELEVDATSDPTIIAVAVGIKF